MARLYSNGFELNTPASGMEWTALSGANASVQNSIVRSGAYAGRLNPAANVVYWTQQFYANNQQVKGYLRFYMYIASAPVANIEFLRFSNTSNGRSGGFTLRSDLKLALTSSAGGAVGSTSTLALSTGQWYRVEFMNDATTNPGSLELRINGSTVLSGSNSNQGDWNKFLLGFINASSTADIYFDDIAFNDANGSDQNSWPGEGKLIVLRPNGNVGTPGFVRQGTDSGGNWSQVNEITPNDISQYVNSTTLNAEDLYTLTDSGIGSSDTVNVVSLNLRYRGNSASGNPIFQPRILKTAGGTAATGNSLTPTSTTWITNLATYLTSPLTMYVDPDGNPWTQATLDSMQAGFKITVDGANRDDITALWVYVDYTPDTGGGVSSPLKLKVAGSFVDVTPKIKVAGSFIDITPKLKSGGSF